MLTFLNVNNSTFVLKYINKKNLILYYVEVYRLKIYLIIFLLTMRWYIEINLIE